MTVDDVVSTGAALDPRERWRLWEACAAHALEVLPITAAGDTAALRYCPTCYTVFTTTGAALNPPPEPRQRRRDVADENAQLLEELRMRPLTPQEKRTIVDRFRDLQAAVDNGAADLETLFKMFQIAYRGESRAYADAFKNSNDKRHWIAQLRVYLEDEIESEFWR